MHLSRKVVDQMTDNAEGTVGPMVTEKNFSATVAKDANWYMMLPRRTSRKIKLKFAFGLLLHPSTNTGPITENADSAS
jgi:hypothetical protein